MSELVVLRCAAVDQPWVDRLKQHLRPYSDRGVLSTWDAASLPAGTRRAEAAEAALEQARGLVLLVSPALLAEESTELDHLISRTRAARRFIAWIPVSYSAYAETGLGDTQWLHDPERPLDGLSPAEQSRALVEAARGIVAAVRDRPAEDPRPIVVPPTIAPTTPRRLPRSVVAFDRAEPWRELLTCCGGDERHLAFVVHGERAQHVALFTERIRQFHDRECSRDHTIVRVDRIDDGRVAVTASDWEARTVQATDTGRGPLEFALRREARHQSVILMVTDGDAPLCDMDEEAVRGLAEFLRSNLPKALAVAKPEHPVRVVLPVEQDPALAERLQRALGHKLASEYIATRRLGDLTFPSWPDVERTILGEFPGADAGVLARCRGCYDAMMQSRPDLRALAIELRAILLAWEAEND